MRQATARRRGGRRSGSMPQRPPPRSRSGSSGQRSGRTSPSWSGAAPFNTIEPVLSPTARISATSSGARRLGGGGRSSARLSSIGRPPGSWMSVGATQATGLVREVPLRGELHQRQAVALGDRAHAVELGHRRLDPARGAKQAVVARGEVVARAHVVPEQPAVVDDARDDAGRRAAAAAPSASSPGHGSNGLRISIAQSIRSPKRSRHAMTSSVKPFAGPGATPMAPVRPSSRSARHARPRPPRWCSPCGRGCGAAGRRRRRCRTARGCARSRMPQVVRVALGAAQARVGEAREALGPVALAVVEVVPDGADEAYVTARDAAQRASDAARSASPAP